MFIDEVRVFIASGKGGDGMVHFRREKYVPFGGPDGGDGGKGGDVICEVSTHLNTLYAFQNKKHFRAGNGGAGGPKKMTGKAGEDVVLTVPVGTLIYEAERDQLIADFLSPEERKIILRGGRGGRGNKKFASSKNQAPRMAERGEPGSEIWIRLELRLIADVGIIGLPNAGKSTLLGAVSNAKPKIADYPFTTLQPSLGVAVLDDDALMVLVDIPGLIAGAHKGAGLGITFLRHIMRTKVLIHVLDGASQDPLADFSQINSELALYDEELANKPQVIAVNKLDLPDAEASWSKNKDIFQDQGYPVVGISALRRENLRNLLFTAYEVLKSSEEEEEDLIHKEEELPVYRYEERPEDFTVLREDDGFWRVEGQSIERAAAMTYWEYDEAVRRFQGLLNRLGIEAALREAGAKTGDTVRIGEYELEWQD